jgi:pimeloyl-ACP methyl ester carboxylesterase
MNARLLVLAATVLASLLTVAPASAQDPPLVLVHGFNSNGVTWADAASRLNRQLKVTSYFPGTNWKDPFADQADQLSMKLPGVLAAPVVVGHSNGGIVAREWSKRRQMKGLLTLSSPNLGAPIANNAPAWALYNYQIVRNLANIQASFTDPNDPSFWIWNVIQGAMAFGVQAVEISVAAFSAGGFDLSSPVMSQDRVGSPYMQSLNSAANLARETSSIPTRVSIATYVPDYHLGGIFRAVSPDNADYWRAALWAAVGTFDVWAGTIASSGQPRDIERAQRMLTGAFLLSLHEGMWCQAVSDPTPLAVTLGGSCYANDTFIPSWSHELPGSLVIPKPNSPTHTQQTNRMIPVLYEVLTTHLGVPPRGADGGAGSPSILTAGREIRPGEHIWSPDARYRLRYQYDGNLVLYRLDALPIWWSGTAGTSPGVVRMQEDGNFVIYDGGNQAVWHSHTYGNPGAYLSVQNNGAFVINSALGVRLFGTPVPANEINTPPDGNGGGGSTPSPDTLVAGARLYPGQAVQSLDRRYSLTYQTDGNLVLYGPNGPRWSTQVFSSPGYAEMQVDGNFVVYASNGTPVWSSGTAGARDARLVVHNDGNISIRLPGGVVLWETGTGGS